MKFTPVVAIVLQSLVCVSCVPFNGDPLLKTIDKSQAAIIDLDVIKGSLRGGVLVNSIDGTTLWGLGPRNKIKVAPGKRILGLSYVHGNVRGSGCVEADLQAQREYRLPTHKVQVGKPSYLRYSARDRKKAVPTGYAFLPTVVDAETNQVVSKILSLKDCQKKKSELKR